VRYLSIFFEMKDLDRTNPELWRTRRKAVATGSGNESQVFKLSVSLTGTESFLTESLILAQNERWRRG
jgi:hypothetical protein